MTVFKHDMTALQHL